MEPFFTPHRIWPGGGPFPHVLVPLGAYPPARAYARAHADLLAGHGDLLGVAPGDWLHATVQGVHHPVNADQEDRLRAALRAELAGTRPFAVQLGPVWPGVTAVTAALYPEDGMAELNRRARAAAHRVPGITPRPPEARFWAHATLAYARRAFPDQRLNRALRALRPARVTLTVDRVHLVTQRQHPERGYYTWDVTEEIRLG
ncbi:2'-5' RNA ligase family protein [Streptomyces sp. NPDC057702]|uniref:2'-5' RNA ligase family protein n=1 Tax=unclassified Streptomyces TaxID=2593676 RepID=UPI0036C6923A